MKLYIIVIIIIVAVITLVRKKEGYGTFGHRAVLNGIKLNSRDFYTFDDLQQQYPVNYWKNKRYLSEYDKEEQKYHAKRFDPQVFQ